MKCQYKLARRYDAIQHNMIFYMVRQRLNLQASYVVSFVTIGCKLTELYRTAHYMYFLKPTQNVEGKMGTSYWELLYPIKYA